MDETFKQATLESADLIAPGATAPGVGAYVDATETPDASADETTPLEASLDAAPVETAAPEIAPGHAVVLSFGDMARDVAEVPEASEAPEAAPAIDPALDCGIAPDGWDGRLADPALGGFVDVAPDDGLVTILPVDPILAPVIGVASDSDGDGVDDTWTTAGGTSAEDWDGDGIAETQVTYGDTVERDTDGDGLVDRIEGGAVAIAQDLDGNGQADTWTTGTAWSGADTDGDGIFDTWVDSVTVVETDTDGDGAVDSRLGYGRWTETDATGDGVADTWGHDGEVTETDTDGDGRFDLRVTAGGYRDQDLDQDGWIDATIWLGAVTESDADGDGVFELVSAEADVTVTYDAEPEFWILPVDETDPAVCGVVEDGFDPAICVLEPPVEPDMLF